MKLRHKDNFGSPTGTAWRLLFVAALMPWLKKRRIQDDFKFKKPGVGPVADEIIAGAALVS